MLCPPHSDNRLLRRERRAVQTRGEAVIGEHPGGVASEGERFVEWHRSLDHSLRKISHTYVKHYDDPERWMYAASMELTDKGEPLARSLEQKDIDSYRRFE